MKPLGHASLHVSQYRASMAEKLLGGYSGSPRAYAAADIESNRVRYDSVDRSQYPAYWHPVSDVRVGHYSDMPKSERQIRQIASLCHR